jgi:hypothetical protein
VVILFPTCGDSASEDFLSFLLVLLLYILVRWKGAVAALGAGFLAGWLCLANGAWALACGWSV